MASIDSGIDFSSWSDDLRDMIRRRVSESGGLALITLSALIAVALATWSVQDPSLSHATDGPVRNCLGTPGAVGADLLMQLFGLAATVLVLPVAVWGWRIATHRPFDREWMRLAFWLAGAAFGAGFAACLPKSRALAAAERPRRRHRRRHAAPAGTLARTVERSRAVDRRGGLGLCTLAAVMWRPASAIKIPPTSSSTSAGRARQPAPRTTTRSARRCRSAGWCTPR